MRFALTTTDTVVSTNALVKQALEAGAPEGLAHRAYRQTGGYGRQGRTWSSPYGGMYESVLLRPKVAPADLPPLGLVAALAVRAAIEKVAIDAEVPSTISVKWPNDVVCAEGKLSGLSFERHAGGVCIGIGVNVFMPQDASEVGGKNIPAYVSKLLGGRIASEKAAAIGLSPVQQELVDRVGDAVLDELARRYQTWCTSGFASFLEEYRACQSLEGKRVKIAALDDTTMAVGTVVGIDERGCLLLDTEQGVVAISSGEAHLR